jgi:hypothetical protein
VLSLLGLLGVFAAAVFGPMAAGRSAAKAAPAGPTALFNGKDLTNFYTFIGPPAKGEPPVGKGRDPKNVFTVVDGMIRVSGEQYGYLATEQEHDNYHLTVEFKWGAKTYPPREDKARDSGVLLHAVGDDKVWMESVECQIIEGGTGDFILVAGTNRPKLTVTAEQRDRGWFYKPGAPPREFTGGRINWFGRDPAWKDTLGYRGPKDVEKPVGEWNVLECTCGGSSIINRLNGVVVNSGTNSSHTKGKILFQSEGAELFFRKIELRPLTK